MTPSRSHTPKPTRAWKHYSKKYVCSDSVKMILSLHEVERKLRKEIAATQVTFWSKDDIDRVYNT